MKLGKAVAGQWTVLVFMALDHVQFYKVKALWRSAAHIQNRDLQGLRGRLTHKVLAAQDLNWVPW